MSNHETQKSTNPPTPPANAEPWFEFAQATATPQCAATLKREGQNLNGRLATLAFDELRVLLDETREELSVATTFCGELPVKVLGDAAFRGYAVDVRGSCSKAAGTRGAVVVQIGGTGYTHAVAVEEVVDGGWMARLFVFDERGSGNSEPPPPPLLPLAVNVMVSAQRRSRTERIELTVDTMDIVAVAG